MNNLLLAIAFSRRFPKHQSFGYLFRYWSGSPEPLVGIVVDETGKVTWEYYDD